MKRIALFFTAAVLASPVLAAEDLCMVKMQQLDDSKSTLATLTSPLKEQVEEHTMMAAKAKEMGNTEECATHASKALELLEKTNK